MWARKLSGGHTWTNDGQIAGVKFQIQISEPSFIELFKGRVCGHNLHFLLGRYEYYYICQGPNG